MNTLTIHLKSGTAIKVTVESNLEQLSTQLNNTDVMNVVLIFDNYIIPFNNISYIESLESSNPTIQWNDANKVLPDNHKETYLVQYTDGTIATCSWSDTSYVTSQPTGEFRWFDKAQFKTIRAWSKLPEKFKEDNINDKES